MKALAYYVSRSNQQRRRNKLCQMQFNYDKQSETRRHVRIKVGVGPIDTGQTTDWLCYRHLANDVKNQRTAYFSHVSVTQSVTTHANEPQDLIDYYSIVLVLFIVFLLLYVSLFVLILVHI